MTDKIEPALSEAEWANGVADVGPMALLNFRYAGKLRIQVPGDVLDEDDAELAQFSDADDIAMVVAAANAALPDDDPRKITREWVNVIYEQAQRMAGLPEADTLERIADALESYLPPA